MRAALATIAAVAIVVIGLYLLRERPSLQPGSPAPPTQASVAGASAPPTGGATTTQSPPAPPTQPSVASASAPPTGGATTTQSPPATPTSPTLEPAAKPNAAVRREAKTFISQLTEPTVEPIAVEKADHFVTGGQKIDLIPDTSVRITTPAEIADDRSLAANTPITVVREVEQIETLSPEQVLAEAGGDLDKTLRVIEGGGESLKSVREILTAIAHSARKLVNVVKKVHYYEITTPAELAADSALSKDQRIGVVRGHYQLEAATVAQIMRTDPEVTPDSIFYVRTVRASDRQGIWGIVFNGLVGNFARGMAIRRGEQLNTYQVEIPRDADERLGDRSSSYLGKLIYWKSRQSYVYNYKENRMGRNPDRIWPGQEIVIIKFQPDELIGIYQHFVSGQG